MQSPLRLRCRRNAPERDVDAGTCELGIVLLVYDLNLLALLSTSFCGLSHGRTAGRGGAAKTRDCRRIGLVGVRSGLEYAAGGRAAPKEQGNTEQCHFSEIACSH